MSTAPAGEIDARNLACPTPVIMAKEAWEKAVPGDPVVILVSRDTQASNIGRALRALGAESVDISEEEGGFYRVATVREEATERKPGESPGGLPLALVVSSLSLGVPPLGEDLLASVLESFSDRSDPPALLVLLNKAVSLAAADSTAAGSLGRLSARGCRVLLCSRSVGSYGLEGMIDTGEIVEISSIVEALSGHRTVSLG